MLPLNCHELWKILFKKVHFKMCSWIKIFLLMRSVQQIYIAFLCIFSKGITKRWFKIRMLHLVKMFINWSLKFLDVVYGRALDLVINSWQNLKNIIDNEELPKTGNFTCTDTVGRQCSRTIFERMIALFFGVWLWREEHCMHFARQSEKKVSTEIYRFLKIWN